MPDVEPLPSESSLPAPGYAAVLVDVVDSRGHASRPALQDRLLEASERVNADAIDLIDPLAITVGDELQATTGSILGAIALTSDLRLRLRLDDIAIRVGIGWGAIAVRDANRSPLAQDGPAWWAARDALDEVAASNSWSTYPKRTAVSFADTKAPVAKSTAGDGLPDPRPVDVGPGPFLDSYLALLDRGLALLDLEDAIVVVNDIANTDAAATAHRLGVGPNAVSMRRSRNHLRELSFAIRTLRDGVRA